MDLFPSPKSAEALGSRKMQVQRSERKREFEAFPGYHNTLVARGHASMSGLGNDLS